VTDIASLFVWRDRRVVIAAITGEIDISNARQLESAIASELDGDAAGLVVDLGGLTFIDGAGVHLLYRLCNRGLPFAVVVADDSPPRRVLDLSGERASTWMHATEDDAVRAVS
jgi:anti-anti-sigma factor